MFQYGSKKMMPYIYVRCIYLDVYADVYVHLLTSSKPRLTRRERVTKMCSLIAGVYIYLSICFTYLNR